MGEYSIDVRSQFASSDLTISGEPCLMGIPNNPWIGLLAMATSASAARVAAAQSQPAVRADTADTAASTTFRWPRVLGAQVNVIGQRLGTFTSPYTGANSLLATGDQAVSHVYGLYLGAEPLRWGARNATRTRVQVYVDVEMARGSGISSATGLAGVTNGDVLRAGSADLGHGPYLARAFVRVVQPLGAEQARDTLDRAVDQLPTVTSVRRLELTAGKLAASDLFDVNRYANTTRTQFMNWGLFQNSAWDFAADTRGYTNGVSVAWITPHWAARVGSFQMPTRANGNVFDDDIRHARGDNAELTLTPGGGTDDTPWPTVRLLGFVNQARMGRYATALAAGQAAGTVPDIVADDAPGRRKAGWGLNVEQPLADRGETGGFLRVGWNDGASESFAFTEVDRHVSAGLQVSGAHWARTDDRVAIAVVQHGIVAVHRAYLAAGGIGFLLGDGQLTYAPERIVEAYYRLQLGRMLQVSPDVQWIQNPGYNSARGPATVLSLRVNARY